MRELLLTIILFSVVSSEEYEPKKRLGIPPEEDPNFWPTRGRRSFWNSPRSIKNLINRDSFSQGSKVDYISRKGSWTSENEIQFPQGLLSYLDSWRVRLCPRKKSISLVLPFQSYIGEETDHEGYEEKCTGSVLGRGRRGDERWRRQQPLFVEEPRWIAIDFNHRILGGSAEDKDPFIVARGKKRNDDDSLDIRERRQLENVISSYDSDPFFVARGKRNLERFGSAEESQNQSFGVSNTADELNSEPRKKRGIETRDEQEEDSNSRKGDEVSIPENLKLLSTRQRKWSMDDKSLISTTAGAEEDDDRRLQRSSDDVFDTDVHQASRREEFPVAKPRYSRPRDKHSNLQSILDEPFFVSRGKKGYLRYGKNIEEGQMKIVDEFPEPLSQDLEILANFLGGVDTRDFPVSPKFETLFFNDDSEFSANGFKRSKTNNKPPRYRRGMLDDLLLKNDDPFYVARGKRFLAEPRSEYSDDKINRENKALATNKKFALFAKTARTELLKKLSDSSQNKGKSFSKNGRNFFNLTNNPINQIYN